VGIDACSPRFLGCVGLNSHWGWWRGLSTTKVPE